MQKAIPSLPKIKVEEKDKEIIVKIYISEIKLNDIEIEVKEDFLEININKNSKSEEENNDWFMNEWSNLSFIGKILLPSKIVPMLPHRSYDGKILEIRLKQA